MFLHGKELIQPVKVDNPDPKVWQYLLEQFAGATGELTAALQY
jgi:Mn-containing catalase